MLFMDTGIDSAFHDDKLGWDEEPVPVAYLRDIGRGLASYAKSKDGTRNLSPCPKS